MQAGAHALGVFAPRSGQRRQKLQPRALHIAAQPQVLRGPGQAAQKHGLRLGRREPGERGLPAWQQRKATVAPTLGIDGHTGRAELVHIAVQRAHRDLQCLGQRLRTHAALGFEQHLKGKQAAGAHGQAVVRGNWG
ncbi:hypothetical protein D3C71_1479370 [compost metagenome]